MEVQGGRNCLVVCASLAKLLQIRIGPCVAEQETPRRQMGDGRQGQNRQISSLNNRMDKWTDKKHGQSDWILGKGRDR